MARGGATTLLTALLLLGSILGARACDLVGVVASACTVTCSSQCPATWGSTLLIACDTPLPGAPPLEAINISLPDGSYALPCSNVTPAAGGAYTCSIILLDDVLVATPLQVHLGSSLCAAPLVIDEVAANLTLLPPTATETAYRLPPLEYDTGGVVALQLPRERPRLSDWTDVGLEPPATATDIEMWLGGAPLYVPPQDNVIVVSIPPGDGRNMRVVVEVGGLFNITSDGLPPDAPIPEDANASMYWSYTPPVVSYISPATVVLPDIWWDQKGAARDAVALRRLEIVGVELGADHSRLSSVYIGEVPCTLIHVNDTLILCDGWNLTAAALRVSASETVPTKFDLRFQWLDTWTTVPELLTAVPRPQVIRVAPTQVQQGTRMLLYGAFFHFDPACQNCTAAAPGVQVLLGADPKYVACEQLTVLGTSGLTCLTPEVDAATPGYPVVAITVQTTAGARSIANTSVVFPERLGVRLPSEGTRVAYGVPSGNGDTMLFPTAPAITVEVIGKGSATCWLDIESFSRSITTAGVGYGLGTSDNSPTLLGNVSQKLDLGATRSTVTLSFAPVGMKGASATDASIIARCQDSRGEILFSAERVLMSLGRMNVTWVNDTLAQLEGPQEPRRIGAINGGFWWTSASPNVTRSLGRFPACEAVLLPGSVSFELSQSLSDVNRFAIDSVVGGFSSQQYDMDGMAAFNFSGLHLGSAEFGQSILLAAECIWEPTGERLRLPSAAFTVVTASVQWSLAGESIADGDAIDVLPLTVINTEASLVTDSERGFARAEGSCRLSTLSSTGLRLSQTASGATYTISADGALDRVVILEVEGATGTTVDVAVECTVWGKTVASTTLRVTAAPLRLQVEGTLPRRFIPSDGSMQFPLQPSFRVSIIDQTNTTIPSIICTFATSTRGTSVRLNKNSASITADASGVITISEANIQSSFDSETRVALELSCRRPQGDGPAPLRWEATMVQMRSIVCKEPLELMQSQTAMPPWSIGVSMDGDNPCARNATLTSLANLVQMFPPLVCAIESNITDTTNVTLFTENTVATVDASTHLAQFNRFTVTGMQGVTYTFSVGCVLGGITIGPLHPFVVTILGCPAGSQAAGVFCVQCPENTYSLGGIGEPCRSCPGTGAACAAGILTLLPNFYRAPSDAGTPITASTELLSCYNSEACVVNSTDLGYSCATGYTGALCGVCLDGYSMFSGQCRKCWTKEETNSLLAFVAFLFIALLAFLALRKPTGRSSPAIILLRLLSGYLQALSALQVFKEGGTRAFRQLMGWTAFVSESPLNSGALQCAFQWSYLGQYMFTVSLPWVTVAGTIAMYGILAAIQILRTQPLSIVTKWRASMKEFWAQGRPASTLMMVLFIGYMPIVSASLRVLDCMDKKIDGRYWVRSNLGIECNAGDHLPARLLSIVVLCAYGFGFPAAIFFFLRRANKEKLEDTTFKSAYGFVYDGYRIGKGVSKKRSFKNLVGGGHLVWWESVILVRKAGIVMLAVLFTDPFYQVVGATLWLSVFFALQQRFRPYDTGLFNNVEFLVLGDLFVTVAVSLLLLQQSTNTANDGTTNAQTGDATVSDILVTIFLMLLNLGALCMLVLVGLRAGCQQLLHLPFCKPVATCCARVAPKSFARLSAPIVRQEINVRAAEEEERGRAPGVLTRRAPNAGDTGFGRDSGLLPAKINPMLEIRSTHNNMWLGKPGRQRVSMLPLRTVHANDAEHETSAPAEGDRAPDSQAGGLFGRPEVVHEEDAEPAARIVNPLRMAQRGAPEPDRAGGRRERERSPPQPQGQGRQSSRNSTTGDAHVAVAASRTPRASGGTAPPPGSVTCESKAVPPNILQATMPSRKMRASMLIPASSDRNALPGTPDLKDAHDADGGRAGRSSVSRSSVPSLIPLTPASGPAIPYTVNVSGRGQDVMFAHRVARHSDTRQGGAASESGLDSASTGKGEQDGARGSSAARMLPSSTKASRQPRASQTMDPAEVGDGLVEHVADAPSTSQSQSRGGEPRGARMSEVRRNAGSALAGSLSSASEPQEVPAPSSAQDADESPRLPSLMPHRSTLPPPPLESCAEAAGKSPTLSGIPGMASPARQLLPPPPSNVLTVENPMKLPGNTVRISAVEKAAPDASREPEVASEPVGMPPPPGVVRQQILLPPPPSTSVGGLPGPPTVAPPPGNNLPPPPSSSVGGQATPATVAPPAGNLPPPPMANPPAPLPAPPSAEGTSVRLPPDAAAVPPPPAPLPPSTPSTPVPATVPLSSARKSIRPGRLSIPAMATRMPSSLLAAVPPPPAETAAAAVKGVPAGIVAPPPPPVPGAPVLAVVPPPPAPPPPAPN